MTTNLDVMHVCSYTEALDLIVHKKCQILCDICAIFMQSKHRIRLIYIVIYFVINIDRCMSDHHLFFLEL